MLSALYFSFALITFFNFSTNYHCVVAETCTKDKSSGNENEENGSENCGIMPSSCPEKSRYRSYDGSCNNLKNPSWGTPQSAYGHLVQNNYYDGVSAWPTASDGSDLPNPREISLEIFVPKYRNEHRLNLNTMQWGQVIAHDMSLTAGISQLNMSSPICCNMKGQLAPDAKINPFCRPVNIPDIDTVHKSEGKECLNFIRTVSSKDTGCTKPDVPSYPLSVVTSYMDLSLTYGSSQEQAKSLREGTGGRLLTTIRNGHMWPPQVDNVTQVCSGASSPNETCFRLGDSRGNQSPHLSILQVILLREHNRVADKLSELNPHWDDETIYQEARQICIAEMQYIAYYEYLSELLGTDNMVKNKLIYPGALEFVNDYDPSENPAILKEHATAAFRHFHTMIQGYLHLLTEDREFAYQVRISDWFNKPSILEKGDSFDGLTRGLTYQAADKSDQYWTLETTRYLFRGNQSTGGDLRVNDIQRSRDHGLGTYTELRKFCGLSVPETFDDLNGCMSYKNVQALKSLYKSPSDIDLSVGGSLEYHAPGALVGPTFLCILLIQFHRTRVGDRYFFENGYKDISFTLPQLNTIRERSSMARLLCDNGHNIKWMQPKAFRLVSHENPLVKCDKLKAVDLSLWAEPPDSGSASNQKKDNTIVELSISTT